ncbi:MAG: hypothetical protein LBB89_10335 [Treponema sp.]|jgi:hypothetical protein|nr:hypothetical protein [Treponema sp.]
MNASLVISRRQSIEYAMSLLCLLCIPLLYFLRRTEGEGKSIWALPLGGLAVMLHYFTGSLITAGDFGFSRWMSGFVGIAALPVLVPLLAALLLVMLRVFPDTLDYAGFTLLWLVPLAAIRSISGDSPSSPIALVFVPLLWIAQAVGIPFFIGWILKKPRWYVIIPSALGIAALPLVATSSWWAFFVQRTLTGFLLLAFSLIPAVISVVRGVGSRE